MCSCCNVRLENCSRWCWCCCWWWWWLTAPHPSSCVSFHRVHCDFDQLPRNAQRSARRVDGHATENGRSCLTAPSYSQRPMTSRHECRPRDTFPPVAHRRRSAKMAAKTNSVYSTLTWYTSLAIKKNETKTNENKRKKNNEINKRNKPQLSFNTQYSTDCWAWISLTFFRPRYKVQQPMDL